jgi:hypothetical protein
MWGLSSVSLIRDPADARLVSQFSKLRLVVGWEPITSATYVSLPWMLVYVTHTRFERLHNVEEARIVYAGFARINIVSQALH